MLRATIVGLVVAFTASCGGAQEQRPVEAPVLPSQETAKPTNEMPEASPVEVTCESPGGNPSVQIDWNAFDEDEELVFLVEGLPAISEDGSSVAVAYQARDGMRGNANLTLLLVGATADRGMERIPVVEPDDYDMLEDLERGELKKRLGAVSAMLARHVWTPLASVSSDTESFDPSEPPQRLSVCGLDVAWDEPGLSVTDRSGKELIKAEYPKWSAPMTCDGEIVTDPDPDDCNMLCSNAAQGTSPSVTWHAPGPWK